MIYLNSNIINKIGNSNRLYYNGSIVYQGYTTGGGSTGDYSLPDVPFMFNYNAKQYSNGVIPNAAGALFKYDCTLSNTNVVDYYGDYLTFNGDGNFSHQYSKSSDNPFNRSGNDPMTIIMKTRTIDNGGDNHPLANRGGSGNWMCRIGNGYQWLHTINNSYSFAISVPYTYGSENIVAYRCLNDGQGFAQNYTTGEIGNITYTLWSSASNEINFFDGGFVGEIFLGDFYWMYCSLEQLTDEQIQQVIEYNEGKAFEPVVPDVPVEPEPDEPETPEIPEGIVSLQYCWDNQIFDIPFTDCYIDMNNVEDDASSNYFITLSSNPNSENDSITSYSICPKENSIFDEGNFSWCKYIMENFYNEGYNGEVVATPLGDGIYYYKFAQPVYLSNNPSEFNAPYWRVNVIPLTIEPEIPDTPIIPDAPEGSTELVVTSINRGYVGGSVYEVMFSLDDGSTIVIDYCNSNPLATGEYSMDNSLSDFSIFKIDTNWNGERFDTCKSVVINNGNNNYDFYVEFTLNGATYHFTYNGDL